MAYPRGQRGWFFEPPDPLSVLEIIRTGTLDLRMASLLWLMMDRRASVLVAAGPSNAGKSTTLNVLLDFLRPEVKQYELEAHSDQFTFVNNSDPKNLYMVASEFSNHGFYIWGSTAIRAFELLTDGYGVGGTVHARTAKETVEILAYHLGLSVQNILGIDAIITLYAVNGANRGDQPIRKINSITLLQPHKDGLALAQIAGLSSDLQNFELAKDNDLQNALSKRLGIKKEIIPIEMEKRGQVLAKLLLENKISKEEVRKAVLEYYANNPPL